MKNRTHKRSLSLLLCAALLLGQLSATAYAETTPSGAGGPRGHRRPHTTECGYMEAEGQPCGFVCQICSGEKEDARPAPGPIALADVRRTGAENVPSNAQGVQDVVLEVTFNDNGDDEMETAIVTALAALPSGDKTTVTAIELTGSAVEITGNNWTSLLKRFHRDSGWDSLTALDLSPMANLKTMRNDTTTYSANITKLQTLTLPDSLTQIGQYAFYHCSNLDLQALPEDLTQIGKSAFSNCPNLALQALPEGLTQIDGYAFFNCTSLALQALPEGLKQIGESAFSNCRGLALQALPNGLTQIDGYAFSGCENLALQALPEDLTQIGGSAFSGCTRLDRIIMESTTAPAIASSTFENTRSGLTFYVPKNGKGYDSGGWEELLTVEYDLTLDLNTLQLKTGQSQKLTATLRPTGAVPVVSWESSDTGVVTVDGSGSVTAVSTGTAITAIITATARQGGETASCTVTVNPSASSGGGGHSSSGGGRSRIAITAPQPPQPDSPVLAVIETPVTVKYGAAVGTADDGGTSEAITRALNAAEQKGRKNYGIAVQYDAATTAACDGFSIAIKRAALDRLVDPNNNVKYMTINTSIADLTFGPAQLAEIARQTGGDVTFTAARATDLTGDALSAVGSRPAYDLKISFQKDGRPVYLSSVDSVSVGLAYTPAAAEDVEGLYLVYADGTGGAEWLYPSGYKPDLADGKTEDALQHDDSGSVVGFIDHFSVYGVGYKPAPAFTDTAVHWAKRDIDFVARRGLFSGTGETTFSPDAVISRGMFVTALGRLAGIDPADYASSGRFSDVAATAYYASFVEWASSKGIVSGAGANTFEPDRPVTREEMAVMMQQYADKLGYALPAVREAVVFTDDGKITGSMKDAVQAMQQADVMNGIPLGTLPSAESGIHPEDGRLFAPKDAAARAEAAVVLRRFVEIVIDGVAIGS